MVSFSDYTAIINNYKDSFNGPEWIFVGLAVLVLVIIVGLIVLLIFFGIRRILRSRKGKLNQEELLDEIAILIK